MRPLAADWLPFTGRIGRSADPDEAYLSIYTAVQEGEKLESDGKNKAALAHYRHALSLLDQLQDHFPKYQPVIVDYRKKRTTEEITKVERKIAIQGPGPEDMPQVTEPQEPLPNKDEEPSVRTSPPSENGNPPNGDMLDNATREIRAQIAHLQADLEHSRQQAEASRQQAEAAEHDKAAMADKLDRAMKDLEKSQVSQDEMKSKLSQLQDQLKNASTDSNRDFAGKKALEEQVARLEDKLKDTEAERDAADDASVSLSHKYSGVKETSQSLTREKEDAVKKAQDLEAKLETSRKQMDALQKERDSMHQNNDALTAKYADAQKKIDSLSQERDSARKISEDATSKLAAYQTQIASLSKERDALKTERDDALSQLDKARTAAKHAEQLMADNATLLSKLDVAQKTIAQFNIDTPKKDAEIQSLRKEVGDVRSQLQAAQRENSESKASVALLQNQLDDANGELSRMQSEGATPEERKRLTEENGILRGIVLRELKEQARREQSKELVLGELKKLEVQSTTLMDQINYLGQPVVKLTDREKALFKQPQIEITENSLSVSAPAAPSGSPALPSATVSLAKSEPSATPTAAATPSPHKSKHSAATPSPSPAQAEASTTPPPPIPTPTPSPTPNASAMISATPPVDSMESFTELASISKPTPGTKVPEQISGSGTGSDDLPQKDTAESSSPSGSGQAGGNGPPNVPDEVLPLVKEAKDFFDHAQYHEAEKKYLDALTKAPNNIYVLDNLGVVRFRAGKLKLAEETFKKAIAVSPDDSFSHCTLGIVYYSESKYDDALNELTRAISINQKMAPAHNYLGITASQKGWQEAAQKELETAIALDPGYADAYFNLAVIFATRQPPNKELARKYYKRATELGAEPDAALEQLLK